MLPMNEPDWHGEKAKRERQQAMRAASERAFVLGMMVTALLIGIGIFVAIKILAAPRPDSRPTLTDQPGSFIGIRVLPTFDTIDVTATAEAAFRLWNVTGTAVQVARVDTMVAAAETATARPTVTPTPFLSATPDPSPTLLPTIANALPSIATQITEFSLMPASAVSNGVPSLKPIRVLPVIPLVGYGFAGTRYGTDGNLYVAHTRGLDIAVCDPNEAYWIIDTTTGQKIDQIADPSMVSPKSIAFDSDANAYILATDCKQRVHAVFKFDGHHKWVDTFPIVGGDDLAVTSDKRIVVALSGFADNSVAQPHLIELRSDPGTGRLYQYATLKIGADPDGHFSSLTIIRVYNLPNWYDFVYMVWTSPSDFDHLQSIGMNSTVAWENLTDSALQSGPIYENNHALQVDNLATPDGATIYGLALDGRRAVQFQSQTGQQTVLFPIPGLNATAFAIDTTSKHWFVAGQPIAAANTPLAS